MCFSLMRRIASRIGADAAIVGSAGVARVAAAQAEGRDVVEDFEGLLTDLGQAPKTSQVRQ